MPAGHRRYPALQALPGDIGAGIRGVPRVHGPGRRAVTRRGLSRRHREPGALWQRRGHGARDQEAYSRTNRAYGLRGRVAQQAVGEARLRDAQARWPHRHPPGRRDGDARLAAGRAAVWHRRENGGAAREGGALHARAAAARAGVSAVAALAPRDAEVPGSRRGHRRTAGCRRRAGEADQLRGDIRRRHSRPHGIAGAARATSRIARRRGCAPGNSRRAW